MKADGSVVMTDLERFETTRETLANTAERANPAPERYDSALARYLAAVDNPRAHERRHDNSLRDELYWNLENKPVSDVMAHAVVSVDEDATFKEIVETLAHRRVSAVAVVDGERKVIGVISESDPLAKMVAGADPGCVSVAATRLASRRAASRMRRQRAS
jgi:ABC-type proline/glycine betaine transport system ATPase subunit